VKTIWVVHGEEEGSKESGAQEKGAQEKTSQEETTAMCCKNQGRQKM
jgi:hypothetical protein